MAAPAPTASQTIGPFFHRALDRPGWHDLTAAGPLGQKIALTGRVLEGDGNPVNDAMVEI